MWKWNSDKAKYEKVGGTGVGRKIGRFASYDKYAAKYKAPQGPILKPGMQADGTWDGTYGIREITDFLSDYNEGESPFWSHSVRTYNDCYRSSS